MFAARAIDESVRTAFVDAVRNMEQGAITRGVDMRDSQPSPDNKRGGLTTVEEKALGAMAKAGSSPLVGVLRYGEAPRRSGLHFMDAPAAAVENLTALAAGGCQLTFFGTGVGNPIGNMVAPTVKVCGNIHTLKTMGDNIDFDASGVLEQGLKISDIGDRLYDVRDGRRIRHSTRKRGARCPRDRRQPVRTQPLRQHDKAFHGVGCHHPPYRIRVTPRG